jgi:hypothetical protein
MIKTHMHRLRANNTASTWRQRLLVAALLLVALLPRAVALDAMIGAGSNATGISVAASDRSDFSDLGIVGFEPVICHTGTEPGSGSDHAHHRDGDCCSVGCCVAFTVPEDASGLPPVTPVPIARLDRPRQALAHPAATSHGFLARAPPLLIFA